MLKVYLGYDPQEHQAWEVAAYSLRRRSSIPVLVTPIYSMNPLYQREWHTENGQRIDNADGRPFSTEFSFARFLVPACEKYTGWALFADCDFLFMDDVAELMECADNRYAALVVKHDHQPRESFKMQGQVQTSYPRKNWSSLILWNCGHAANQALTAEVVNKATGKYLHGFSWLADSEIGQLPGRWNHLVDYDPPVAIQEASALHYTLGGPWFEAYRDCGYADVWRQELEAMNGPKAIGSGIPGTVSCQGPQP